MLKKICEHLSFTFLACIPGMIYTSIAPLLPPEIERRKLSSIYSGAIFR